ncbi:hypothetical protein Tco_0678944 [Tanacetum coccineum]|uniref:Uncharacterized protein n=1 Tax=Tanacetum coccineum TaxID=301880 RepID=A0ABQ4XGH1_9ASTR
MMCQLKQGLSLLQKKQLQMNLENLSVLKNRALNDVEGVNLQLTAKLTKMLQIRMLSGDRNQRSHREGSSAAHTKYYANLEIDSDAILHSLCSDTSKESANETDDVDESYMDLTTDNPVGDDDAAGYGTLLDETPVNKLTNLMSHPVYTDTHTTSVLHNPEGNPKVRSFQSSASEVPFGTPIDVQATNLVLEEMFLGEADHHISSPPANTTYLPIKTPQPISLQAKAKKLMQKAKKNMRKINFKKAIAHNFTDYDHKIEALTNFNASKAFKKVVQARVLTEIKKLLPTHIPKAVANYVRPRWFTKKSGSANAIRRTTWFDLLLKSNIDQNEDHILGPSTVVITKKLKEIIQKDKLTIADLQGAGLEKLKRHYKNNVELEYHVDQLKAAVVSEAQWNNDEEDVSKPRSFERHMSKSSKPLPSFYNNDFYYLVDLSTKENKDVHHYLTKALNGIHHWEDTRQDFFKAEINNQTSRNVYSDKKIISVVRVVVKRKWGYRFLSSILVRRSDKQEYTFSYADLPRLSLNDIEDMYLLKFQDKMHHLPSEDKRDFNNALLLFIRRTNDKDIKKSKEMVNKIDQVMKRREQLCRLEEYVGGRPKTINPCVFMQTVEVNLCGLLGLGKSDLSGDEYRVQLGLYLCRVVFRYRCIRTELITPDLTCPSTHQLRQNSGGDSEHDLSFDKSASPEHFFGLARVSLAEASKLDLSFGWSEGDSTSSCPPNLVSAKLAYSMVWRHPDAAIDDPRPATGYFSVADVRRLSAHVIKLRDMPEAVLVLSGLIMGIHDFLCLPEWTGAEVQEEPHLDVRSTLQRLPFYCAPPTTANAVISDPTLEDLAVGLPSSKILAKAEASSALAQLFGSTTRPSLFVGDSDDESDGDDDACVKILLVTPLHFAYVIPSSGNQGRSSTAPAAEGFNTRDSRGKGIMADDAAAPSVGASRSRPSSGPVPSFRDVSGDAIHADFFPFSAGLYYATYPQDGLAGNCEFTREEWDAPYQPTFRVLTKEVFKDLAACKTVADQFPTPGEMSHHEYVQSADSRLKGYEERVAGVARLELQVSTLKKQVSGLNDKLVSSDASFAKSKAKGNERKKKIKSLTKSLDNLHAEVARLSAALNQATVLEAEKDEEILRLKATPPDRVQGELLSLAASAGFERGLSMHQTKDEFAVVLKKMANFMPVILQLEPEKLARPANVPTSRDARVSPPITKESTMTPASKSLELSTNADLTPSVVASKYNEEMVNAEVDRSGPKMTDDIAAAKSGHAFVQGISIALQDVMELVVVGSGCASSDPNDVVVALSAGEKGDGLVPSSAAGEDAAANPSGV